MLLQYNDIANTLRGERDGFVFQTSDKFNIATVAKRNDRGRYIHQHQRQIPLMAANQHWQNLSAEEKANWNNFASEFPEPTKANAGAFLTGYQLFCKRQQYVFLNEGIDLPYMVAPSMLLLPPVSSSFEVRRIDDSLIVSPTFSSYSGNIIFSIFLSYPQSLGRIFQHSEPRYMGYVRNFQRIIPNFSPLYNAFTVNDPRSIAPPGTHIITASEALNLRKILDPSGSMFSNTAGGPLKEVGYDHWAPPNAGATNLSGFTGRAGGSRETNGYISLLANNHFWNFEDMNRSEKLCSNIYSHMSRFDTSGEYGYFHKQKITGYSIRVVANDPEIDQVVGNNGLVYQCHKVGAVNYVGLNLCETLFANGDPIPLVPDQAAWNALDSSAMCHYNNLESNSYTQLNSSLDITELYRYNFGILPKKGDNVLMRVVSYSKSSGQFFPEIRLTAKVA
jgi:hypothetical protein